MKRKRLFSKPRFQFRLSVYEAIRNSIGKLPAENGGLLGGDVKARVVTHFFFDTGAKTSRVSYTPDIERINARLKEWDKVAARLLGFVHSHPPGLQEPSAGDVQYAARILEANPDLPGLVIPIVASSGDASDFAMHLFVATRKRGDIRITRAQLVIIEEPSSIDSGLPSAQASNAPASNEPVGSRAPYPHLFEGPWPLITGGRFYSPGFDAKFTRVREAYDLEHLARCSLVCVGTGGAGLFLEQLARAGVGRFVLLDPDVYQPSNIGTQHCYADEIGVAKVDALAARIKRINPNAIVVTHQAELDDFDDASFAALIAPSSRQIDPAASLLCACTDSFYAQARVNKLSLHLGVPALFSQVYQRGVAAEVVWMYPGLSQACCRCILSSRYRTILRPGFKNITSDGSPISSTLRLNAIETFLALAILHHGRDHQRWGRILHQLGDRQLVQVRCAPDAEITLGLRNFSDALAGSDARYHFSDETVWRPQHREHPETGYAYACPDCGGSGDLRSSTGTFGDTREVRPQP
jgi:proteasome lid subunit RPN8/RPN11